MQLWSYQLSEEGDIDDMGKWEILDCYPSIWWKTRDEAFFCLLADLVERNEEYAREDPEEEARTGQAAARIAQVLDPANWAETQPGGVVYWVPSDEGYYRLVDGRLD